MKKTFIHEGDRVELRAHARKREGDKARENETPRDRRFHYHEGTVVEVGQVVGAHGLRYVVKWENMSSQKTTHPESDLKVVRLDTGKRRRHQDLYGPHGLKTQVEREGERLREAIKELWIPTDAKREFGTGHTDTTRRDFIGIDGIVVFDIRREHYDKLVKRYNRLARIHDRDNCC